MAQATNSLPQPKLDTFQPISASAVHVLARLAARNAVKEQLRADGVRVTLVRPAQINAKTNEWLFDEARDRARRMGMFEKPKGRRRS